MGFTFFSSKGSSGHNTTVPWQSSSYSRPRTQSLHPSDASSPSKTSGPKEVMSGLRSSDRLFFELGSTRCIMENNHMHNQEQSHGSEETAAMAVLVESEDPYLDFMVSMEEMVMAHGFEDWEFLQELLEWYLNLNVKKTHGLILAAFVDLLLKLSSPYSSRRRRRRRRSCH